MSDDKARLMLRAFRNGYDTAELARLFGMSEAQVCELLRVARALERHPKRIRNDGQHH